jgi:hypothetical protein
MIRSVRFQATTGLRVCVGASSGGYTSSPAETPRARATQIRTTRCQRERTDEPRHETVLLFPVRAPQWPTYNCRPNIGAACMDCDHVQTIPPGAEGRPRDYRDSHFVRLTYSLSAADNVDVRVAGAVRLGFGPSCGRCSCADPDGNAAAPGQRGVDNPVHLRQQDSGSIVLSVGDSNLDGIAQRQHAPPLACVLGRDVQAMLAAALREISKEGLHYVTCWPQTRGR